MNGYDSHRVMLDPGRTALALRGLRRPDGLYPFMEPFTHRRRAGRSRGRARGWDRALLAFLTRRRPALG
jgi:hypothetical protein